MIVFSGPAAAFAASPQSPPRPDTGWTINTSVTGTPIRCENGRIKSFTCANVELLSYLPTGSIDSSAGADIWGWHDSTTGREFVIIGGYGGYGPTNTAFIEVTDPVNPKYLGILPPHGGGRHGAHSVKVYKNHAFITYDDDTHGLQIFDLTRLRDVQPPRTVFQESAYYTEFVGAHTIAVNQATGFAYANITNTCGGGLHMIDIRTPTKPTFAGCYVNPNAGRGYVHDTQCVVYRGPDTEYQGREICLNATEKALDIVDVTDKRKPKSISIATYPNVAYTHQAWFTEDQRYVFLDDELDEPIVRRTRTIVFDMSDLDDPVLLTEYLAKTGAIDHNLYIDGRYMHQGNNNAGLRIIDIVDPKNPKEVGYLSNIGSAWGPYPYFKNDVVAVSTSAGLFLAKLLTP